MSRTPGEPNAQNSELNREEHPSGARIEDLMNKPTSRSSSGSGPGLSNDRPNAPSNRDESVGAGPSASTPHRTDNGNRDR